jgi:hypothetical protein
MTNLEISRDSIGFEIITETGVRLGWLKRAVNDDLKIIEISRIPIRWLPDFITGIYRLSIYEIMSAGHGRIIVLEGAEERLIHVIIGWLDRFNWRKPSWEKQAEYVEIPSTNQLPIDSSVQDDWGDDDGAATSNRKPTPEGLSPFNHQAEIPLD